MRTEHTASQLNFRISVCSREDVPVLAEDGITHLLSIDNPGEPTPTPDQFTGLHWRVEFDDIVREEEVEEFDATLPEIRDVQQMLDYADCCLQSSQDQPVHLLVHCVAGVSRSTAAAFAMFSSMMGEGHERDALEHLLDIRPQALPNKLVVQHADKILNRKGKMIEELTVLQYEDQYDGDTTAAVQQDNE